MENKELIEQLELLNKNISLMNKRGNLFRAFMVGILSGLGSVIGATIVVGVFLYAMRNVEFIPIIGSWFAQIIEYATSAMSK